MPVTDHKLRRWIPPVAVETRDEAADAVVHLYTTKDDRPAAVGYSGKRGKPDFHHCYADEARRSACVAAYFAGLATERQRKAAARNADKQARESFVNPYRVGDVFYTSWGYDQTNIDFYQVVGVGAKSVMLREIGSEEVKATGDMSGNVVARKDCFKGAVFRVIVQSYVGAGGGVSHFLRARHGQYIPWDGSPRHETRYH